MKVVYYLLYKRPTELFPKIQVFGQQRKHANIIIIQKLVYPVKMVL